MEEIPIELLEVAIKNPVIRGFIEGLVIKVIAELMHRRQADPAFLAQSDSAFRKWGMAQTEEEKDAALKALFELRNSPA